MVEIIFLNIKLACSVFTFSQCHSSAVSSLGRRDSRRQMGVGGEDAGGPIQTGRGSRNPTVWSLVNCGRKDMGNTGKAGHEIYVLMTFFLKVRGERNECR